MKWQVLLKNYILSYIMVGFVPMPVNRTAQIIYTMVCHIFLLSPVTSNEYECAFRINKGRRKWRKRVECAKYYKKIFFHWNDCKLVWEFAGSFLWNQPHGDDMLPTSILFYCIKLGARDHLLHIISICTLYLNCPRIFFDTNLSSVTFINCSSLSEHLTWKCLNVCWVKIMHECLPRLSVVMR